MALDTIVSDIMWNLDIIRAITNHQTLMVHGNRLEFDNRVLQWLRRPLTGDSRQQILNAIQNTFTMFEEVLRSYQCNIYIQNPDDYKQAEQSEVIDKIYTHLTGFIERRNEVFNGLEILSTFERYNNDHQFNIRLKSIKTTINRLYDKCVVMSKTKPVRRPNNSLP